MKPMISSENLIWMLSQNPTSTLEDIAGGVK
jgi:hypothetical protein